MLKRFISVPVKLIIAGLLLTPLAATPAWAQGQEDFMQQIEIDSDNNNFDIAKQTAIFENNVVVRQGTLTIKADRLEAKRAEDGTSERFVATGSPATYEQKLDDGSIITASADTIIYEDDNQILILEGEVEVTQNNSVIRGHRITYNFATQQMQVRGSDGSQERVTTIFKPKKKSDDKNEPTNR